LKKAAEEHTGMPATRIWHQEVGGDRELVAEIASPPDRPTVLQHSADAHEEIDGDYLRVGW